MDWKDVGNALSKLAPAVGAVIGGPAAAIGGAVGMLAKAFGLDSDAEPEQVMQAINQDPEALLKLRALDVEIQKLYFADKQSARQSDVAKTQATGRRDYALYSFAALDTIAFYGLLAVVLTKWVMLDGSKKDIFLFMSGAIVMGYKEIRSFFFGSSKSSADKTKLLADK